MHTIYLLCENVDLGYHVRSAYVDEQFANSTCDTMNSIHRMKLIGDLQRGCGYNEEAAIEFVDNAGPNFFIEAVDVNRDTE